MNKKKQINLNLPEPIYKAILDWKETTGTSVNDYCYDAIARKVFSDGLIKIKIRGKNNGK